MVRLCHLMNKPAQLGHIFWLSALPVLSKGGAVVDLRACTAVFVQSLSAADTSGPPLLLQKQCKVECCFNLSDTHTQSYVRDLWLLCSVAVAVLLADGGWSCCCWCWLRAAACMQLARL